MVTKERRLKSEANQARDQPLGRPKVTIRRTVLDQTEDERELEQELAQDKSRADLLKTGLKEGLARAPDIALLGGGFYLGYTMNMRPGIEIPSPLGGTVFLGLPDFGGVVDDLTKEVEDMQRRVDASEAVVHDVDVARALCESDCYLANRAPGATPEQLQACLERCRAGGPPAPDPNIKELAALKAELQKHRIAQGFLFLIMTWTISRPGFFQGVGEIIPG